MIPSNLQQPRLIQTIKSTTQYFQLLITELSMTQLTIINSRLLKKHYIAKSTALNLEQGAIMYCCVLYFARGIQVIRGRIQT